jgi:hypothetical protein
LDDGKCRSNQARSLLGDDEDAFGLDIIDGHGDLDEPDFPRSEARGQASYFAALSTVHVVPR